MGKNTEALIQVEIVKYLQSEKIYFFSCPNEAAGGNKVRSMQMVSMGMRSGVSDLIVFLPSGEIIFVEVKAPKGKQSDRQKKFEKRVTDYGYKYFLVYSVNDVKNIIDYYGKVN